MVRIVATLTSTEPSGSSIIDGNLSIVNQSNGFTITMDMYLQDGNSNDVYWINNYNIEAIEYPVSILFCTQTEPMTNRY